jgi:hypothetical protein
MMAFTAILFMQLYQSRFLVSIIQPVNKKLPQSLDDVADLVEEGKLKLPLLDLVPFRLDEALVS